jgi:hypothetical protein
MASVDGSGGGGALSLSRALHSLYQRLSISIGNMSTKHSISISPPLTASASLLCVREQGLGSAIAKQASMSKENAAEWSDDD